MRATTCWSSKLGQRRFSRVFVTCASPSGTPGCQPREPRSTAVCPVQHKRLRDGALRLENGKPQALDPFEEAGFPPGEARARGELLAIYLMGEAAIHVEASLEARLRLVRRQVRSLTS